MPDIRDSLVNSLIGAGSAVDGDLDIEGMLRIDGDFRGSIRATGKILVGAAGRVEASIRAQSAIIGGLVKGDVYVAESLRLLSGGIIIGNIYAPRIEIEENTIIHGDILVSGGEPSEEKLSSFVVKHGGQKRFIEAFRNSGFAVPAPGPTAPRPRVESIDFPVRTGAEPAAAGGTGRASPAAVQSAAALPAGTVQSRTGAGNGSGGVSE